MLVGFCVVAPSLDQARNYQRWFDEHGRKATVRRRFDGSYVVTRIK
jgi:hypothetical protein